MTEKQAMEKSGVSLKAAYENGIADRDVQWKRTIAEMRLSYPIPKGKRLLMPESIPLYNQALDELLAKMFL